MKHFIKRIKFGNLLFNTLIALLFSVVFAVSPIYTVSASLAIGVILGFVKTPKLSLFMPIQTQVWVNHIEEELFKDNGFLSTFKQADKANINARTVNVPQAGASSNVEKNRTELPAKVTTRTDVIVSYDIDEFTSDPIRIPNADTVELSYDKRASVISQDTAKLSQEVAESVLLNAVSPTQGDKLPAKAILTTASDIIVDATAPEATGKRKAYSLKDLQNARSFFVRQNSWQEGQMYALITAEAEAQLFPADSVITATYMQSVTEEERRAGVMYKVQGFKIMTRSSVLLLDDAGNFKPADAVGAATDDEGILLYNGNSVEFALGDIVFFEELKSPTYYGDIYSFLVRAGARTLRTNYEGVLCIKQGKSA